MDKTYTIGNLPSLNALRAFVLSAQYGSIKQASKELRVTSSAVTHQIQALEEQISIQLFHRDSNRMRLTHEGHALYDGIHTAFGQIVYGLNASLHHKATMLRISAQPTFAQLWITRNIASFHNKHPDIRIELTTGIDPVDFDNNLADLAILLTDVPIPNRVCWRTANEFLVPVCSPAFLAKLGTPPTPNELKGAWLIEIRRRPDDWSRWFALHGDRIRAAPTPSFIFENSALGLDAALHGLGVVMGRSSIVCDYIREGTLVPPCGPLRLSINEAYYLVSTEAYMKRTEIVAFRQWFEKAIQASQATAF